MNNKDKYFIYAKNYSRRIGKPNDTDDLANYLRSHEWEYRKHKAADFFRIRYGRTGTAKQKAEQKTELHGELSYQAVSVYQDHSWMLWDEVKKLPRNERVLLFLHYKYGLSLLEIGEIYEIGDARVSQIITGAEKTLQRRMEEETRGEKQGTFDEVLQEEPGTNTFQAAKDLQ